MSTTDPVFICRMPAQPKNVIFLDEGFERANGEEWMTNLLHWHEHEPTHGDVDPNGATGEPR